MRGISRMNWLVLYCTVRLILVTWIRPNLIIGFIFSRRKKGPIRKENSIWCITSLRFSFYQITNTCLIQIVLNTWEELNTTSHQLLCSSICLPYSTLNYTGIEQVIQWTTWRFLNSIPPTLWLFILSRWYFLYKILFNTVYTCRFNIYIFLYFISELWFMWFMYTVCFPILWKLIYLIKFN